MSNNEIASLVTASGVKTSRSDVENASRLTAFLVPHSVPRTKEVERFFGKLSDHFPDFEPVFLLESEHGKQRAHEGVNGCISVPMHSLTSDEK
jgi:hypothetical protein